VKGTKTVLISAYLEHRTDKKEVSEKINVALFKPLCCVADIHTDHFGFAYGTADIMCPIPSGCETPSSIAVTSAVANSTGKWQNSKLAGEHLMAMPSLEMLQLLGVNRVVVYKTNCSPETQRILDYYTQKGLLEVIPWSLSRYLKVSRYWQPSLGPGELHYFGQIPALNDCLYRYMYQSKYVALHDIDELILPQKLLPLLEKKYGANKCYRFENHVFPINFMLPPPASQTLPPQADWKNVPGLNILAHLYKESIFTETHSNFKIIVNPRAVFSTTVHGALNAQHGWSALVFAFCRIPTQKNLTKDKLIYDGRLLSYSAHFIPAVNKVLRETGFLPRTH
uniref:Glycosyltransferase family 92 protein n=1 Tax=Neolamprologus brichardi TaxID=32507 RepID=A0A3Q4I5B9_NEOBR